MITVLKDTIIFFFTGNSQLGKAYQGDCSDASSQEDGERRGRILLISHGHVFGAPLTAEKHSCGSEAVEDKRHSQEHV